jgi:multidrug efflux system membrane fusion protein
VNQRNVQTGVQDGNNIQILSGIKAGDTVVVDGADRLRDGADVEIPNPTGKIAAPSGGEDDAARAARRAQAAAELAKSCSEDVKKLCPTAKTGKEVRLCLMPHRDELSADCSKAFSQMRRGGPGGRRGGGGGGAP